MLLISLLIDSRRIFTVELLKEKRFDDGFQQQLSKMASPEGCVPRAVLFYRRLYLAKQNVVQSVPMSCFLKALRCRVCTFST